MLMSREREMLRKRDKDIELAIKTLEEVSSKDREEYEKAAENRSRVSPLCACSCDVPPGPL